MSRNNIFIFKQGNQKETKKKQKSILPPREGILLFGLRSSMYTCLPVICTDPACKHSNKHEAPAYEYRK